MSKPRIRHTMLPFAVIRQQQEPFAIEIQPPRRIDAGNLNVVGECALIAIPTELAQDLKRFIEE